IYSYVTIFHCIGTNFCSFSYVLSSSHFLLAQEHIILDGHFFMVYQATGRGFVVKHIKLSANYRLYSTSHFVKGYLYSPFVSYVYLFSHSKGCSIHWMQVILLLVVYLAYGNDEAGSVSYILLTLVFGCLLLFAALTFNMELIIGMSIASLEFNHINLRKINLNYNAANNLIYFVRQQLKQLIDSDAAISEDTIAYNIIPLDAHVTTNAITAFPEVQAAVAALKYFRGLPKLPANFPILLTRNQSRLNIPEETEPIIHEFGFVQLIMAKTSWWLFFGWTSFMLSQKLDDAAVNKVFLKSLDNYIKWCDYLCVQPAWSNLGTISGENKLLFLSLYFLIWVEAANIRFLSRMFVLHIPPRKFYAERFSSMVGEVNEILRQRVARPAVIVMAVLTMVYHFLVKLYQGYAIESILSPLDLVVMLRIVALCRKLLTMKMAEHLIQLGEIMMTLMSIFGCFAHSSLVGHDRNERSAYKTGREKHRGGKTSFVEHRTFLRLYHSFHRLWIFLAIMFQKNHMFYVIGVLDVTMMFGAYSTTRQVAVSRIVLRLIWFSLAAVFICFLYRAVRLVAAGTDGSGSVNILRQLLFVSLTQKTASDAASERRVLRQTPIKSAYAAASAAASASAKRTTTVLIDTAADAETCGNQTNRTYVKVLQEDTKPIYNSVMFKVSGLVIAIYGGIQFFLSILMHIPTWLVIYLLDIHIFYTIASAFFGFLLGARDRLGEVVTLLCLHMSRLSNSQTIPGAFMRALHVPLTNRTSDPSYQVPVGLFYIYESLMNVWYVIFLLTLHVIINSKAVDRKNIVDAAHFAPFWNQIIKCLREEDYITDFEMEFLMMPKNSGRLPLHPQPSKSQIHSMPLWLDNQLERYFPIGSVATFSSFQQGAFVTLPACVLRLNILLAKEIAAESNSQDEIVERIARDDYMKYAVKEVYHTLRLVLTETLEAEGRMW
ncbi:LOW QUALITY PROTEIN: hypothetical protein HID58_053449, partial [Brassica napus]